MYNFATWMLFCIVYRSVDFPRHFKVPEDFRHDLSTTGYYAFQVQTQMYGTDIVPATSFGRAVVSLHGLLAWSQTIVFLAPWIAITR